VIISRSEVLKTAHTQIAAGCAFIALVNNLRSPEDPSQYLIVSQGILLGYDIKLYMNDSVYEFHIFQQTVRGQFKLAPSKR